jgi:hypothetical protein
MSPSNVPFLGPDVDVAFSYHPPTDDQIRRYAKIRLEARNVALAITDLVPPSLERDIAFARLREAVMWANAAIACNEPDASADAA